MIIINDIYKFVTTSYKKVVYLEILMDKKIKIMAKSENNIITHGLSGKIGDLLVFKQVNGKTIVSKVPKKLPQRLKDKNSIELNFKRRLPTPKL